MACFFGLCTDPNCEKCKPKYLKCPSCGQRTYISDTCVFCRASISKEVQEEAKDEWKRTHMV